MSLNEEKAVFRLLQALVRGHVGLGVVAAHSEEDLLERRHRDAEELQAIA